MLDVLWLVPTLPFAGALVLAVFGGGLSRTGVGAVGASSVGLSAVAAGVVAAGFMGAEQTGSVYRQDLWEWMAVDGFFARIGLYLDALAVVMILVITGVGFLIHLYAAEFMADDDGYRRFFVAMNLFVGSMLVLVLADNLVFLYLGWEGVGLCSYLLIGHWYRDAANGAAARKAFIVTRIGDAAMAVGLFLLFAELGTLDIQQVLVRASREWEIGSGIAIAAAALLLAGAVGKSAQLPLQTWLPDAMAGPTPVSALIHAATMVTAGMYLIARTYHLYLLAPPVHVAVGVVGAATLLLAACSALVQRDIKRVLAYSTISQIGYMFLALGVGAWSAALFHFMTHAFFKALLFLAAGVVILALHHEHDLFRMGGLRREMPLVFWTFVVGAASMAGFPLITAGFFSKEAILLQAWATPGHGPWLWAAGWLGVLLTALYSFRLVFLVFYGEQKTAPSVTAFPPLLTIPLIVLAVLSIIGGWIELPETAAHQPLFTGFLASALPFAEVHAPLGVELGLQIGTALLTLLGIYGAYLLFLRRTDVTDAWTATPLGRGLVKLWFDGWGFDRVYDAALVRPYRWAAAINRDDVVDAVYRGLAWLVRAGYAVLHETQTGRLRWYASVLAAGVVVVAGIVVWA